MGKLHDMVNWGRKLTPGPTTSAFLLLCRDETSFTAVRMTPPAFGAEVLRASPPSG